MKTVAFYSINRKFININNVPKQSLIHKLIDYINNFMLKLLIDKIFINICLIRNGGQLAVG